ncbi:MAG: hypothetical protein GY795_36125 [Desulfobacterales bacterium]|nr:hypothetical protein [Desulfobacterales bacterium]
MCGIVSAITEINIYAEDIKYRSKSFSVSEDLRGFGNPAGLLPGYT